MAAYGASLTGGFVYEDSLSLGSQWVRALARWSQQATTALIGDGSVPARVVNLALHLVNGLVLWAIGRRVVAPRAAVFAAGVFLLHPVQTESVAYLGSRPELLMTLCLLGAYGASLSGWITLAAACALLALLAKEMAVMAWLLVPLWAWQTDQRWSRTQIAVWTLAGCVVAAAFDVAIARYDWLHAPAPAYVAGQLTQAGRLVWLLVESLVNPQALTIDHDWTWITRPVAYTAAGAWLLALLVSRGWWRFALLWTLVALSPRLVLPMPDGIHERHLYLPMIAWSLAVGAALFPREA